MTKNSPPATKRPLTYPADEPEADLLEQPTIADDSHPLPRRTPSTTERSGLDKAATHALRITAVNTARNQRERCGPAVPLTHRATLVRASC